MLKELELGPDVDLNALGEFSELLKKAYENGELNDATVDVEVISEAANKAAVAFGVRAVEMLDLADAGELDDDFQIFFAPGLTPTAEMQAAAIVLLNASSGTGWDWDELDRAYGLLSDQSPAPNPGF